ncbi:MAG: N-formylglutamate amidohydrolase, partial [Geminicoccaceae bacterium]
MLELEPNGPAKAATDRPDAAVPKQGGLIELYHPQGEAACLVLCDHAGRRIPRRLDRLGLPEQELCRHIGWDIGAADVTRALAALLDAPAVLCHSSRLMIDPNRKPGDPSSIPEIADGTFVPGNQSLDAAEARRRLERYFIPYHR